VYSESAPGEGGAAGRPSGRKGSLDADVAASTGLVPGPGNRNSPPSAASRTSPSLRSPGEPSVTSSSPSFVPDTKAATTLFFRKRLRVEAMLAASSWLAFPLILFAVSRLALLYFSHLSMTAAPDLFVEPPGARELRILPALDGLCRWDCGQFERIAATGYSRPYQSNFFPLLPLLANAVHQVTGVGLREALILVANVAALAAFIVVYRIFQTLEGDDAARSGLALFVAFPFAFFQASGYPESLMVLASASAIFLALRGHHVLAGAALGLGVLARHLTMLAGASLLIAQLRERGRDPRRFLFSPAILGLVLPWLFLGVYGAYLYVQFDDPLAFVEARNNWGDRAWWGLGNLLSAHTGSPAIQVMYAYLPFALFVTAGAIGLARWRWLELAAYAILLMGVVWAIGVWGLGRYSASCWPAFLPLGVWLSKRPNLLLPTVVGLAVFQGLFFYLFAHQYPLL
jgi:hypothetical protein